MAKTLALALVLLVMPLVATAQDYPKAEIFGGFSIFNGSLAIGGHDDISSILGTGNGHIPPGWSLEGNTLRRNERDQFYGFQVNAAGNFHEKFGLVADFGWQHKDLYGESFEVYEYLFGPRFSMRADRATVFAHALFGGTGLQYGGSEYLFDFSADDDFSDNSFAMGFGGGVDVNAGNRFAIRVVQFDWTPNRMSGDWSASHFRLGFGIVYKTGN